MTEDDRTPDLALLGLQLASYAGLVAEERTIPEPPLSGVALRDVEERDDAAGDLP